jgi:hypothetical protein
MHTANANGTPNTIILEAGTYRLTAVADTSGFGYGLPVVTSTLIMRGARGDTTIIERAAGAPLFALLAVEKTGNLTLQGLTMRGGSSGPGPGPGGLVVNAGTLTIRQSTITQNGGVHDAGGISNRGGEVTIVQSAIVDNADGDGPGGGIVNSGGGLVLIDNSTLAGNLAVSAISISDGGAIANIIASGIRPGIVSITNSTIAENTACGSGGIGNSPGGIVTMLNTILAQNRFDPTLCRIGTTIPPHDAECTGEITSVGHNLIGDPTGCTLTLHPSDLTGDPGLDTFTDNDTPGNGHFPLLPTSQAIDAGNDAVCPTKDQLGQRRIGRCDIGAIRFLDGIDRQHDDDPAGVAQAPK